MKIASCSQLQELKTSSGFIIKCGVAFGEKFLVYGITYKKNHIPIETNHIYHK